MNTKVLLDIFTDKMHDNKIMDVVLKALGWWFIVTLWLLGMVTIISHIIMNPSH